MSRVGQALDRLRVAGARLPHLESPYPLRTPTLGPGCCVGELEELQEAFRGSLPDDYLEFLSLCRRIVASDVFTGYFLYSPLALARPGPEDGAPSLLHVGAEPYVQELSVFPVGGDGGGNLFLLTTTEAARGQVWKWSHEAEVRFDGVAKEGLTRIADSFTEFVERVADDWEHFVAGDRDWKYASG